MSRVLYSMAFLLIALAADTANADTPVISRLTVTNPAPSYKDYFGLSVGSLGADRLVVGMPQDSTAVDNWGAAYVISATGAVLLTITNPAPEAYDRFGCSVAGVGSGRIVVGADSDNAGAPAAGSAYLFDTNGRLLVAITNPIPQAGGAFGSALAVIDDHHFAVGAPQENSGTGAAGCVFIYDDSGALQCAIPNPYPGLDDRFGSSLGAVRGGRLLVGAPYDDVNGVTNAGSVYVYDSAGHRLVTVTNPTPAGDDGFGWSVAGIGTNRFAVGAISDDTCTSNGGSVYVYDLSGQLLVTITNPAGGAYDWFGNAVAEIGDRRILVGGELGGYQNTGAAWLFSLAGERLATLTNTTFAWDENFGHALCGIGSNRFVVSAPYYESGGSGAYHKYGTVYVYTFKDGRSFYVNDSSVSGDVWCTAPGNDANAGTNASSPKASLVSLLSSCDLEPRDTVYVDTGWYSLSATGVEITASDSGSEDGWVRFVGNAGATVLAASTSIVYGVYLHSACDVSLSGFVVTGGQSGVAIEDSSCCELSRITIRDTDWDGLLLRGAIGNRCWGVDISGCRRYGVDLFTGCSNNVLSHCTVWSNCTLGVAVAADYAVPSSYGNHLESCTLAFNVLAQLYVAHHAGATLSNSIVVAAGAGNYGVYVADSYAGGPGEYHGDYNDLFAMDGANLGADYVWTRMPALIDITNVCDWRARFGGDAHSLSADPLFVSGAGDFHLRSSVASGTYVKAVGGWTNFPGEYSPCIDAGDRLAPFGNEPEFSGGILNLGSDGDTPEASRSRTGVYYVNDDSLAGDVWCVAAGDDAHSGTTPGLPKATVQDVLADYDLGAGDTIYVDTGHYLLTNNIVIGQADGGGGGVRMTIRGNPGGTVLDGGSTNEGNGIVVNGATGVELRDLVISNTFGGVRIMSSSQDYALSNVAVRGAADYGVSIEESWNGRLDRLDLSGAYCGINLYASDDNRISHCLIHHNRGDGIRVQRFSGSNSIVHCTVAFNGGKQISTRDVDTAVDLRNSILVASGAGSACVGRYFTSIYMSNPHGGWYVEGAGTYAGDYNDLCALNGADVGQYQIGTDAWTTPTRYPTLADWQGHSTQDVHSLGADPLFVSNANDLHVRSAAASGTYVSAAGSWTSYPGETSPTIDAGDPSADYANEPCWNGARLNLGAYGNTPQASRSLRSYYVNDGSTVGDAWCSAAGNDANEGTTPAAPKATMQAVVSSYDLEPGDRIYVDSGVYPMTNPCTLRSTESGTAADRVCVIANTGRVVVVITNWSTAFYLEGAEYVDLSGFVISNAHTGVYCFYAWDCGIRDLTVRGAVVGVKLEYGGYHQVRNVDLRDGQEGFMLYESVHNWLMNSVVWSNSDEGVHLMHGSAPTHLYGCTIGHSGYQQIDLAHTNTSLEMWNCIVVASGSGNCCIWQYDEGYGPARYTGDYNLFQTAAGSSVGGYWRYVGYPTPSETLYTTLSSWRTHSTQDVHSLSGDPLFVSNAGDLHLRSSAPSGTFVVAANGWTNFPGQDSPGIDAGNATDSCALEPPWNGNVVDVGAYGNTPFASRSADEDGDELSNSFETQRVGSDPHNADSDGDGESDGHEHLTGMCPTNAQSVFKALGGRSVDAAIGDGIVQWPSAAGRQYRLEYMTNFANGFGAYAVHIPATPPLNSYTVTLSGVERQFYRINLER